MPQEPRRDRRLSRVQDYFHLHLRYEGEGTAAHPAVQALADALSGIADRACYIEMLDFSAPDRQKTRFPYFVGPGPMCFCTTRNAASTMARGTPARNGLPCTSTRAENSGKKRPRLSGTRPTRERKALRKENGTLVSRGPVNGRSALRQSGSNEGGNFSIECPQLERTELFSLACECVG